MKRNSAFTLTELMIAMSIGLLLLTVMMNLWIALVKSSYQEVVQLELSEDYLEVVSYLRSLLGGAKFEPYCLNPEWMTYSDGEIEQVDLRSLYHMDRGFKVHSVSRDQAFDESKVMVSTLEQFPNLDLGSYKLQSLKGSDLVEMLYLLPLQIENRMVKNIEDIKGIRDSYILATDCKHYVLGEYVQLGANKLQVSLEMTNKIKNQLSESVAIQYYKVKRELLYLVFEKDRSYLVHNFLDGSSYMRFPNVVGMRIEYFVNQDKFFVEIKLLMPSAMQQDLIEKHFYIRLLGL